MRLIILLLFVTLCGTAKSQIFGVEVGDTVTIHTSKMSFVKKLDGIPLNVNLVIKKDVVKSLEIVPLQGHTTSKQLEKILVLTRKYYRIDKKKEKVRKCYKLGCMHEIREYKDSKLQMLVDLQDDLEWKMKIS